MLLLTYDQIALAEGVKKDTVVHWVSREGLPAQPSRGRRPAKVRLDDFLRWRDARNKVLDLNFERAKLARVQTELNELKLARERGDLISAEEVQRWVSGMIHAARSRLLTIPRSAAPRLAALTDPLVVQDRLKGFIENALSRLSHTVPGTIGAGLDGDLAAAADADSEPVGRQVPRAKPRKQRRARSVEHR